MSHRIISLTGTPTGIGSLSWPSSPSRTFDDSLAGRGVAFVLKPPRARCLSCALLWLPRGDEVASVECGKTDFRRNHADPDERTHRRPVEGSRWDRSEVGEHRGV